MWRVISGANLWAVAGSSRNRAVPADGICFRRTVHPGGRKETQILPPGAKMRGKEWRLFKCSLKWCLQGETRFQSQGRPILRVGKGRRIGEAGGKGQRCWLGSQAEEGRVPRGPHCCYTRGTRAPKHSLS